MKRCPACYRSYDDDTLLFCLDDGTSLVVGGGPSPPETVVLPSDSLDPTRAATPPLQSTITAVAYGRDTARSQVTKKRSALPWIMLGGVIALFLGGLLVVVGFLLWKANDRARLEPSVSYSSSAPNSNSVNTNQSNSTKPANANATSVSTSQDANQSTAPTPLDQKTPNSNVTDKDSAAKPTEDPTSLRWLEGVWKGEGYQTDTKSTWAMTLTVHDGSFAVDYPTIPCSGRWELDDKSSRSASFTEVLTRNANLCSNNGHILIEKVNDSEVSLKFSHAGRRDVVATAVLTKRTQ